MAFLGISSASLANFLIGWGKAEEAERDRKLKETELQQNQQRIDLQKFDVEERAKTNRARELFEWAGLDEKARQYDLSLEMSKEQSDTQTSLKLMGYSLQDLWHKEESKLGWAKHEQVAQQFGKQMAQREEEIGLSRRKLDFLEKETNREYDAKRDDKKQAASIAVLREMSDMRKTFGDRAFNMIAKAMYDVKAQDGEISLAEAKQKGAKSEDEWWRAQTRKVFALNSQSGVLDNMLAAIVENGARYNYEVPQAVSKELLQVADKRVAQYNKLYDAMGESIKMTADSYKDATEQFFKNTGRLAATQTIGGFELLNDNQLKGIGLSRATLAQMLHGSVGIQNQINGLRGELNSALSEMTTAYSKDADDPMAFVQYGAQYTAKVDAINAKLTALRDLAGVHMSFTKAMSDSVHNTRVGLAGGQAPAAKEVLDGWILRELPKIKAYQQADAAGRRTIAAQYVGDRIRNLVADPKQRRWVAAAALHLYGDIDAKLLQDKIGDAPYSGQLEDITNRLAEVMHRRQQGADSLGEKPTEVMEGKRAALRDPSVRALLQSSSAVGISKKDTPRAAGYAGVFESGVKSLRDVTAAIGGKLVRTLKESVGEALTGTTPIDAKTIKAILRSNRRYDPVHGSVPLPPRE